MSRSPGQAGHPPGVNPNPSVAAPSGDEDTARDEADQTRRPGLTPVTLFLTLLVAYMLIQVQLVLILVLLSLLLATILERPVHLLERRYIPRPLAILAVYIGLIASLVIFFVLVAPAVADQASIFRADAPERLEALRDDWRASSNPILSGFGQDLIRQAVAIISDPTPDVSVPQDAAIGVATGVGGGILGLLTILVITFYYLMEKDWLRRLVLMEIAPSSRARVDRIWGNVEAKVGDWIRGQLTLCLIIGLLATIGYGVMGVRFWPVLGLWAGLTEIIPIVGPWLGGIPAVIIALTQSWNQALVVIGFIVILQLLENTVLVPRIMRGAVGLTPLTVFVAILIGTQFLGLGGAVLAIPVAAAVQVVLTDYLDTRRELSRRGGSRPGWRWMRGSLVPVGADPPPDETPPAAASGAKPAVSRPAPGWSGDLLSRVTKRTDDDRA